MFADITKMFREVHLNKEDQEFPCLLTRYQQVHLQDQRMTHLTFGVTSSLFLDTQVQRQVRSDYQNQFPKAAAVVLTTFHVDNCLMGTDILEDAVVL